MGDFETAVGPMRRELVLLARRLTGSRAAADDVVQEAMLRAWKGWSRWRPKLRPGVEVTPESANQLLKQWLIRITSNTFANHYRSRRSEARAYGAEASAGAAEDAVGGAHGECPALPGEDLEVFGDEVTEALDALQGPWRDAILLSASGMNTVEIAEVTGMRSGTVFSRLFRTRAELGKKLADYAASEYGIGPKVSGRARVDAPGLEPEQVLQAEADCVDDIVAHVDDAVALLD